jgi:uncharacterized membrane protein
MTEVKEHATMMNGMMNSMMGWMMGVGLLGWVLVIALLVTIVILLAKLLVRSDRHGETRSSSPARGERSEMP